MATIIEAIAADGRVARIELTGNDVAFPVDPGVRYRVVDGESGDAPDTLRLRREEGDLVVDGLPEGERIRIEGFFTNCGTQSCEFATGTGEAAIRPGSEPIAAMQDGTFLMWLGDSTVADLPTARESEFNWRPVGAIAGGLAVVGAGAGGGGGGAGTADSTPPDAPTIKDDAPTNQRFPIISGTGEPNSTITLTIDVGNSGNRVTFTTTVNGDGDWIIETAVQSPTAGSLPSDGLPVEPPSTVQAIATDGAGLNSPLASGQIMIDVEPPDQIAKITAAASDAAEPVDDQGVAINTNGTPLRPGPLDDGASTNDRSPTLSGVLDAPLAEGDRVLVYRDGVFVGRAAVDGLEWRFADRNVPAGTHVYEARTVDIAGNEAAAGNTFTLTIDGTPPPAPTLNEVASDDIVDSLEADAGVTISGTAEAGARVRVTWGEDVRQLQVDGSGQFTTRYTRDQLPGDGAIPVAAAAIDSFGNVSEVTLRPVTLVTRLPDEPAIDTSSGILAGTPNAINASEITNLAITGTATPGNQVSLQFTPEGSGPALRFEGTAGLDGRFAIPIARTALPDGQYQVRVSATDIIGNSATSSRTVAVLVDTQTPTATATIDRAEDDAPRLTGTVGPGDTTNDTSPTLSGAVPTGLQNGDRIVIQRDGSPIGDAQIQGDRFVFTDRDLVDGRYAYATRIVDAAGNTGPEGSFFELQIDATPPAAPGIAVVAGNDVVTGAELGAGVTVNGTATPTATVELDWNGQRQTVAADASGQWSATFASPPQGRHTISATVADDAGNVASASRSVNVDTIAPATPQIFTPEGGNDVINEAEAAGGVGISGRAEAGARVELNWGNRSATAFADGGGNWSANFSSPPGQGGSTITAVAIDDAGNRSGQASRQVSVDTVAPGAPAIDRVTGDDRITVGDLAGGIQVTGSAEAGARIVVNWAGETRETTASNGRWSVSYADAPLQGPSQISAVATDTAGNTGSSSSRNVTANTIPPPPTPSINTVAGDNVVNADERAGGIAISGQAQAGATIEVSWDGVTRTTTAGGGGGWSVNFSRNNVPDDGTHTVSATASNSGGSSGPATLGVIVDTTAPARPGLTVSGDNEISAAEGVAPIPVGGATEAGATVTVTWGGVQQTTVANGAGQWAVQYATLPVGEGTSQVQAFATDAAGNVGATVSRDVTVLNQTPTTTVTIESITDNRSPDRGVIDPGGLTNDTTPTLTLSLSALLQNDESVVIRHNGTSVDVLDPNGTSFSYVSDALADGVHVFTAQVVDTGGLLGPLSQQYSIILAAP
ncbi:MAG: Ig-like domain-containing protein [Burkholderiaceae bacterium]